MFYPVINFTREYYIKLAWLLPLLFLVFLPFNTINNIILLLLVISGIIYLISNFKETVSDKRFRIFLFLFICIYIPMVASLPDAINFDESFRKVLSFFLYVFIGLSVISILKDHKAKDLFLFGIGILLTLWTIDALWQYLSGRNLLGFPYEQGQLRGIFYPKYRIGIVMSIFSSIYFEFLRRSQDKFSLSWVMLVPFISVIILSGNRTSWFTLFLSIVLYLVYFIHAGFYKQINLKSLIYGALTIITIIISIHIIKPSAFHNAKSLFISRLSSIEYNPQDTKKYNALEHRVEIWESGLRIASIHWINGIGVRGFRYINQKQYIDNKQSIISERTSMSTHPHQITLEILVETGVIGVIGYIIFWVILFKILLQTRSTKEGIRCWPWFICVIVSIFPLNMHKAFYGHFSSTIIWVLIALAIAYYPVNEDNIQRMHNYYK